ncbi:optic atrophy 3 protein homolog [Chrysoperla carnea]|uniref:optic atrophy 3 protein homolog n=1 Tax=Chrysoperla carnea TaxID=189513 RepID=UPI001D08F738|nr:optic atrophy 3 protein homolog [Chrysoperla carnea]
MVVGAFPAAKLASLFIKQISKPIATLAKERAKSHPFFRTYICMPPAQFYNWCEIKTKMWVLNMGRPVNIPVLSEAMAIELGANLLGEGIIFIIAAGLLIAEYTRQVRKETAKEQARLDELQRIQDNILEIQNMVKTQEMQIQNLSNALLSLDRGKKHLFHNVIPKKKDDSPPPSAGISKKDSPSSSSQILSPVSNIDINRPSHSSSILSNALLYLESDIFYKTERQRNVGLITKGLDYLYYNSFIISSVS